MTVKTDEGPLLVIIVAAACGSNLTVSNPVFIGCWKLVAFIERLAVLLTYFNPQKLLASPVT